MNRPSKPMLSATDIGRVLEAQRPAPSGQFIEFEMDDAPAFVADEAPILAARRDGHITTYPALVQGSDEWMEVRRGLLTASEIKLILTPTLNTARNDKSRAHVWELLAQRISGFVEPSYIGDDMMRGWEDEIEARRVYSENVAPVTEVGFITNDRWGFTIGYSPDGIVGDDGLIECKSRRQKFQIETIVGGQPSEDYVLQLQTALLVSEREWLDFISYSGGLPMCVFRVYPDETIQDAIIEAATQFEDGIASAMTDYRAALAAGGRFFPTKRRVEMEMHL